MSVAIEQEQRAPGAERLTRAIVELGPAFAEREPGHDAADTFVKENYAELKARQIFSAAVPADLGGGGASHGDVCEFIRMLARFSPSTALAFSMHSHLLALSIWRHRKGAQPPAEPLLRRMATEELVLVSSGASDWLDGSGTLTKADGGYRFSARKIFGSGSPAGDILVTTGVLDGAEGKQVLHFGVNLHDATVAVQDNWRTMGMRSTGSNDIVIDGFFVPEASVTLRRPAGKWHVVYDVVATVALPLIYAAYTGVAESARDLAVREATKRRDDPATQTLVGRMDSELTVARGMLREMVAAANDGVFQPGVELSAAQFQRRTACAAAAIRTVELAMEAAGGRAFFRSAGLERLFRDIQGARYHPLQAERQYRWTGRVALGLDPVG